MEKTQNSNMNGVLALGRIRVVLTRPSHPGNIGAAARAMKTMGLSNLVLVRPAHFPDPVAEARASGADAILTSARVVDELVDGLDGVVLAVAMTARRRDLSLPIRLPRDAAQEVVTQTANGDVALVFGNEKNGLSNDELSLCHMPVTIPSNPDYSSLNLGAAVQLMCYETRLAALDPRPAVASEGELAGVDEVEDFLAHLERAAVASEFLDPARPGRLMARLRRLFARSRLEKQEVNILRGILAALEAKAK